VIDAAVLAERFLLTRTESLVARLVAQGATNREAAEQLGVSVETVRSHLGSAFRKTGASNRAALVALAFGAPFGHGPIAAA
jgi:DNA-binding CsgD family transcriptional regulator